MKHLILLFLISISLQSNADAADLSGASIKELLSHVDVTHPYYGNDTYGPPKIDTFKGPGDTKLLSYQAK